MNQESERILRWVLAATFILVSTSSIFGLIIDVSFGINLSRVRNFTVGWVVILGALLLWYRGRQSESLRAAGFAFGLTAMATMAGWFFNDSWLVIAFICAQMVIGLLGRPRLYYITATAGGLIYGVVTYLNPYLWPTWPVGMPEVYALVRVFLYLAITVLGGAVVSLMRTATARQIEDTQRNHRILFRQFSYALSHSLEGRDPYTAGHGERVARYAEAIARRVPGWAFDSDRFRLACVLHDLGKIGIPDDILHKPGRLTEDEYEQMKQHSALGGEIIGAVEGYGEAALWVRHHHERWDGRGYPDRVAGEAIPLPSRVIGVADTLDTITSHRQYHRARQPEEARAEVRRCAGTQFDPVVVSALEAAWEEILPEMQAQAGMPAV